MELSTHDKLDLYIAEKELETEGCLQITHGSFVFKSAEFKHYIEDNADEKDPTRQLDHEEFPLWVVTNSGFVRGINKLSDVI